MRIALGADHAGVALKNDVKRALTDLSMDVTDFGTDSEASVDYPDFARTVGAAVASGTHDRGILVCGSGIGMAIAANKIAGVRAANVLDVEAARSSREHNDANVLALAARITATTRALEIVRAFLDTPFAGGRHARRVSKISDLERRADD